MRFWVNPDRSPSSASRSARSSTRIQKQNTVNPAGQIGGEPVPPGQQFTYTVRAQGRLVDGEQFGDIVVRANPDGSIVRLQRRGPHRAGRADLQHDRAASTASPRRSSPSTSCPGRTRSRPCDRREAADGGGARPASPTDLDYAVSLDTTLAVTRGHQRHRAHAVRGAWCWSSSSCSSSCRAGAPR